MLAHLLRRAVVPWLPVVLALVAGPSRPVLAGAPPADDACERNASEWGAFASDGAPAEVVDEESRVQVGEASVRLDTESGFDTGLYYPRSGEAHWDLSGMTTLAFWEYGMNDHPEGFQGNQPIVVLVTPTGDARYEPLRQRVPNRAWAMIRVPLAGGWGWTRVDTGEPDLADVSRVEIHHDTWDYGFSLVVDGLRFHDHVPGTPPPPGPAPPPGIDPDAVPSRALLFVFDPVMENKGGVRMHEAYGWFDPVTLTAAVTAELEAHSHGRAPIEVVETDIVDDYPFFEDGFRYDDATYDEAMRTGEWHHGRFDYARFVADAALAKRVERGSIDEVFVYGAPYFEMWESTMAGDGGYWCNSPPVEGVPSERLFVIMGWNYERGVAEALHSWGHRAESVLDHAYGPRTPDRSTTWSAFCLIDAKAPGQGSIGDVHFPVNGLADYDYCNPRNVSSDADCWYAYPDLACPRRPVGCDDWSPFREDPHREYLEWWYDHMPHVAGAGADRFLANWWRYLIDVEQFKGWDGNLALASGRIDLTILDPADGEETAGLVPVAVRAAADGAAGRVDLYADGEFVASDPLPPYRFVWDARDAAPGSHVLEARAYELWSGAESRSPSVTVVVAPPPPPPDEVSGPAAPTPLTFATRSRLVWEDAGARGVTGYNLYRGSVRWLDDGVPAGRIAERLPGPSAEDRERPGPGTAWYYLVTGVNGAGEGPPGAGSAGGERPIAP
ncbi:MAG: hypothetical protein D6718_13925 [Acidobacteria bacterium]|nr:MAG: hypothetical protein D6718_13925 [Acidobacteriota bacterium]